MDKLKYIRVQQQDGSYSSDIPLAADAQNISMRNGNTLQNTIGSLDVDSADDITTQLSNLTTTTNQLNQQKVNHSDLSNYIDNTLASDVTSWLNRNVTPTGSTVSIDKSLTIENSAADAKAVGDFLLNPQPALNLGSKLKRSPSLDSYKGTTWTYNQNNDSYTVTGTSTGIGFVDLMLPDNNANFPNWLKKGQKYLIKYSGQNIQLRIYNYIASGNIPLLCATRINQFLQIPINMQGGILIRFWFDNNKVINETVKMPEIYHITYKQNSDIFFKNYSTMYDLIDNSIPATSIIQNFNDINETCCIFYRGSDSGILNHPPISSNVLTIVGPGSLTYGLSKVQIAIPYYARTQDSETGRSRREFYVRTHVSTGSDWSDWEELTTHRDKIMMLYDNLNAEEFPSLNDVNKTGIHFLSSPTTITDYPFAPCWLLVFKGSVNSTLICQMAIPYNPNNNQVSYRIKTFNGWTDWYELGTGSGGTTINNTYTITTSPTITTDSNGWLQAIDTNTQTETNKTDMTGPIMSMLNSTGYCHLGQGIFYVSGNIDMPQGATLEGCGHKTIIRLLNSVSTGYCVRMGRYNTVKNIRFSGGYGTGSTSTLSSTIGSRNGVVFISDRGDSPRTMPDVMTCILSNCWFENFRGSGFYSNHTGGGLQESILANNLYMQYCDCGINLDQYTEYHKFTNIITFRCYYACINNGGNNVFTACTFHGTIGFQIVGSKQNSAHGSCIGCTFNHIDNWNHPDVLGMGTAIKITNAQAGFIFTGCQIWYGGIDIQNSGGISFGDCLIGGNSPSISITGTQPYLNILQNCIFRQTPSLTVNSATRFINCYKSTDGSIISSS